MSDSKAREAAARALSELHIEASLEKGSGWRVAARRGANAAIDAYIAALGETHAIVPREPTEAMLEAAISRPSHWPPAGQDRAMDAAILADRTACAYRYRAMLKAAEQHTGEK